MNKFKSVTKQKMSDEKCDSLQEVKLTEKQQEAYDFMVAGKNIFLTGPSGTGKSLVIKLFREKFESVKKIAITSTTGISALLVGGTTLHSFLGIGLGTDSVELLTQKITTYSHLRKRWQQLDVLIIDEISMLPPELFDKLEKIASAVRYPTLLKHAESGLPRKKPRPFGGIQLILTGDFLQLPVVNSDNFCFEADSWNACVEKTVYLTEIMRQADMKFQELLGNIRYGVVTDEDRKTLENRIGAKLKNSSGIRPTIIHTVNADVDAINNRELKKLITSSTELFEYEMEIYPMKITKGNLLLAEKYRKTCIAPSVLRLCVGAQVMLLCNLDLDSGLANGSRGVITGFSSEGLPIVRFLDGCDRTIYAHIWKIEEAGHKILEIHQIPLKLAYAITTHKSQGCTLDFAEVDLGKIFTWSMGYVALSRVKTITGLSIKDIHFEGIKAHPKALTFYRQLEDTTRKLYPEDTTRKLYPEDRHKKLYFEETT